MEETDDVQAAEDLARSEELIGEDLSDLLPYYEMAYLQEHGNWFWLEEKEEDGKEEDTTDHGCGEGRWVWIPAEDADRFSRYVQRMVKASGRELPTMRSQSGKGDT